VNGTKNTVILPARIRVAKVQAASRQHTLESNVTRTVAAGNRWTVGKQEIRFAHDGTIVTHAFESVDSVFDRFRNLVVKTVVTAQVDKINRKRGRKLDLPGREAKTILFAANLLMTLDDVVVSSANIRGTVTVASICKQSSHGLHHDSLIVAVNVKSQLFCDTSAGAAFVTIVVVMAFLRGKDGWNQTG
jgi:hypothetical protein